jgi:hypothetical protein
MEVNQGKSSFSSQKEAQAIAKRMSHKYSEAFTVYQAKNGQWYVGGKFATYQPKTKLHSLVDLKEAWAQYLEHDNDNSVTEFVSDITDKLAENIEESVDRGSDAIWTLIGFSENTGIELGFKNSNSYLVLEISNGTETINPKMGGAFSRHIPLMKKVAANLVGKPVVWSTWNRRGSSQWANDDWFYKLDSNNAFLSEIVESK